MFKNHLEMIGRNEPVSKKAKFWQSYVRSLKGSEDIRAQEKPARNYRGIYSPIADFPELSSWPRKSIFDDPICASDRITSAGYRYLPVHRDIYGYTPRNIHPTQSHGMESLDRYRPMNHVSPTKPFDYDRAWQEHLDRMAVAGRECPSRYSLYLVYHRHPLVQSLRPAHEPCARDSNPLSSWLNHLDNLAALNKLYPKIYPRSRSCSPTPVKPTLLSPRPSEVAYNYAGMPIYGDDNIKPSLIKNMLNPSPFMPKSAITADPFWWSSPSLKPFSAPNSNWARAPSYMRDSYLSPIQSKYLWEPHPIRNLGNFF